MALVDHKDGIAVFLDLVQQVAGNEDGQPIGSDPLLQKAQNLAGPLRVHAVRGFVEDQEPGPAQHGPADSQPLFHTLRIRADLVVLAVGQADAFEDLVDVAAPDAAEDAGGQLQVLSARKVLVKRRRFDHDADRPQGLLEILPEVHAEDADAAAARMHQARNHVERGALAGAVGTEKTRHLPGRDLEREMLHRMDASEALAQVIQGQGRYRHLRGPFRGADWDRHTVMCGSVAFCTNRVGDSVAVEVGRADHACLDRSRETQGRSGLKEPGAGRTQIHVELLGPALDEEVLRPSPLKSPSRENREETEALRGVMLVTSI